MGVWLSLMELCFVGRRPNGSVEGSVSFVR